jgi:ribulose-5-phosphate 4-epimerase/fuculose-1-phosphate aldolase
MKSNSRQTIVTPTSLLATAWRVLGRLGLVDTIFNHISACLESSNDGWQLYINPEGVLPMEIAADDIHVLPLRSYTASEAVGLKVNPDGLHLHSAIHCLRMRPGVIIHTHAPHCLAVGCTERGLLPLTQTALEFSGDLQLIDYNGVFRSQSLTERMESFVVRGGAALLRNHGALIVADTVEEAFYMAYYLEEACKLQVLALSQGLPLSGPSDSAIEDAHRALVSDRARVAPLLFEAFSRTIGN